MNIKQHTRNNKETTDVVWGTEKKRRTGTYYVIVLLSASCRQNTFCCDTEPLYVRSACYLSRYICSPGFLAFRVCISALLYLLLLRINALSSYFSSVLVTHGCSCAGRKCVSGLLRGSNESLRLYVYVSWQSLRWRVCYIKIVCVLVQVLFDFIQFKNHVTKT